MKLKKKSSIEKDPKLKKKIGNLKKLKLKKTNAHAEW